MARTEDRAQWRRRKLLELIEETNVEVHIEYYDGLEHKRKFLQLVDEIKKNVSNVIMTSTEVKQAGSFEITVNDQLVYSKLQMLAFPSLISAVDMIKDVSIGYPVKKIDKYKEDCVLL